MNTNVCLKKRRTIFFFFFKAYASETTKDTHKTHTHKKKKKKKPAPNRNEEKKIMNYSTGKTIFFCHSIFKYLSRSRKVARLDEVWELFSF